MRITATTHHGSYFNVAEMLIPGTLESFEAMLANSPYSGTNTAQHAGRVQQALMQGGYAEVGWTTYRVVYPNGLIAS